MKQYSIDEEIVAALNFSNSVLLDQCFRLINYPLISSKSQTKQKQKQNVKSKFQKVIKKKQDVRENSNKVQSSTLGSIKKKSYDEDQSFSKIKINADEIDIFSKTSLNEDMSRNVYTPNKVGQYSVSDFINQTSISSSKNKFSPINAWKANSTEKYHSNNFQISANSSYNLLIPNPSIPNEFIFDDFGKKSLYKIGASKPSSSTKSASKKGKKFQKCIIKKASFRQHQQGSTNTLTTEMKPHQVPKVQLTNSPPICVQSNPEQHISLKQFSKYPQSNEQCSQQSFYDNETRDTCELAPSKLQKLIEVEDNKYKEIVLKTYYKHQK